MNQFDKTEISSFIQKFPKDEVIQTLNSIDKKISSLHTISSKDFLYFNTLLKEYYAKIKEISEANNSISLFFSKELPDKTEKIKEKNNSIKAFIDKTRSNTEKISEYLSIIYSAFDLVIVPFNNYKQNLITFKYILANLKLHLGYVDLSNHGDLKTSANKLEEHVETIYKQIEEINNRANLLSNEILGLKNIVSITGDNHNEEMFDRLKNVSNQIRKLSIEDYWPSNITLDLSKKTQSCFASLGDVITNIQYHDIIRQKMEHIQSSQKTLIQGLNNLETANSDSKSIETQIDFIVKIPEITDIQVAQLLYTNKDYQTSIEKITSKLISVGHDMKDINSIYTTATSNVVKFEESFINQLISSQESFSNYAKSINSNCSDVTIKFKAIHENYETLKIDYNSIFNNEKLLRKEIKKFEKLIEINGKNFGKELVKRLIQLLTDLQLNSNSIKTNLNNITSNYRTLQNIIEAFNCEDKTFEIGTDLIVELEKEANNTKKYCKDFGALSIKISEEIASSINKIEYYKYFKLTVEEIVEALNNINEKVNYDNLKSIVGGNKEILDKIEQLYTMKSERDIHQLLTESGKNIDEILESEAENENNDIDDMDIELF